MSDKAKSYLLVTEISLSLWIAIIGGGYVAFTGIHYGDILSCLFTVAKLVLFVNFA